MSEKKNIDYLLEKQIGFHGEKTKQHVIKLRKEGHSQKKIGFLTGMPQSRVSKIIKKFNETGSLKDKKRTGSTKVCQNREDNKNSEEKLKKIPNYPKEN